MYSIRPRFYWFNECFMKGYMPLFASGRPEHKIQHRVIKLFLGTRSTGAYRVLQDLESRQVMRDLLRTDDYHNTLRRYANRLSYSLMFGERDGPRAESGIRLLDELNEETIKATEGSTLLVDLVPALMLLPERFSAWKRKGNRLHRLLMDAYSEQAKQAASSSRWCFVKEILKHPEARTLSQESLVYLLFELHAAAVLTTPAQLNFMLMAAVEHPEHLHRVQEELDSISNRLPSFDDIDSLPYLRAFIQETLRWRPVAPLAVPHSLEQDDEYEGYRIPKGSWVLLNNWSIRLDRDVYEDPEVFSPQRWIDNPELPTISFSMGRRACSGQAFAMNTLFIIMARILWSFDIKQVDRPKDQEGKIQVGVLDRPPPFGISFTPRSQRHREVIERESEVNVDVDRHLGQIGETFR
ncbi:cytochrome P450 [Aspergillus unguis]